MLRKRNWELYSNVRSRLLKIAPVRDYSGRITMDQYMRGLEINVSNDSGQIEVEVGKMLYNENVRDELLTFQYDTYSINIRHYHLVQVNDVRGNRSILIQRKKWFLKREVSAFAYLTNAFLQGLYNYSSNQAFCESLAKRYGISAKYLPIGFGFTIEDWEKKFNVPSVGSDDVLGSYMYYVHSGRLKLDGKPSFD